MQSCTIDYDAVSPLSDNFGHLNLSLSRKIFSRKTILRTLQCRIVARKDNLSAITLVDQLLALMENETRKQE